MGSLYRTEEEFLDNVMYPSKHCPVCNHKTHTFEIAHPFFRHFDFQTIALSGIVSKCEYCQMITNCSLTSEQEDLFKHEDYSESKQTDQTISVPTIGYPVTRSYLQAELLTENIKKKELNILDIGCYDGSLLVELDKRIQNGEMWGFDINSHIGRVFPNKMNFHFCCSDIDTIDCSFDLIVLSHSIMYTNEIQTLFQNINKLLKKDGKLFIQIPDLKNNPYYSLMGDQVNIFTSTSLINILQLAGFKTQRLYTDWFPREVLIIAELAEYNRPMSPNYDSLVEENVHYLDEMKIKLENLSAESNLAVLGTTVNAAYVDTILREKISFFVDENPNMIGKCFRGKKTMHPKDLSKKDTLIIPFGKSNHMIEERFKKRYQNKNICF
jgi:trans-aconitate methyltransferase